MDFLSADTFQLIIMIIKVILLDVALGADNSAIIGMAARNLNVNLRKKAILYNKAISMPERIFNFKPAVHGNDITVFDADSFS